MAKRRGELPGRVVVVTFVAPEMLARFEGELELGLEMFTDRERAVYAALGFDRASFARVWLHPRVWLRYAGLVAGGARLRRAQGDTLQLGGDAVFEANGRLAWIHRGTGPEDRPTVERLRQELLTACG